MSQNSSEQSIQNEESIIERTNTGSPNRLIFESLLDRLEVMETNSQKFQRLMLEALNNLNNNIINEVHFWKYIRTPEDEVLIKELCDTTQKF